MHCSENMEYSEEDSGGADSSVQVTRLLVSYCPVLAGHSVDELQHAE